MNRLIEKLSAEFPVIVRTTFHIQIETVNGFHNIWSGKRGLKYQLCGQQSTEHATSEAELIAKLRQYDYAKTDLAFMQGLTQFIGQIAGRVGVFVDAGWKKGQAKIAIIRQVASGDMDITVRLVKTETNIEAERLAIDKALEIYPEHGPVYSDCKPAVEMFDAERVQWLPRKQNREADALANLREKK